MNIAELAKTLGQNETDVKAFVECVSYWMSKGYTYEAAIARHMQVMEQMANNALRFPARAIITEMYDDLRAKAAA
jgi:hypothetical protein